MDDTSRNRIDRTNKTRRAMIAAGVNLIAERPIDAIPIDDFVAAAGVAKGSFFNHFVDKQGFAQAIAIEVRAEIEGAVRKANAAIRDPIQSMARGMQVGAEFALSERKKAFVMIRTSFRTTARHHPLNRGVVADLEASVEQELVRPEATNAGLLFWLGLCQTLMLNIIERELSRATAAERLREMLVLALSGLGIEETRVRELAAEGESALLDSVHLQYIRAARLYEL